jgi:large subunit ribosomal protein L7/L12
LRVFTELKKSVLCSWQVYPTKIVQIVEAISQLNLLEVADLNALLKSRLNISDAPVMMASGPAAAPAASKEVRKK